MSKLNIYLNYHNNVLNVMKGFLLEKWNQELEELNSQTNPKQMIQNKEILKKKPKIFQLIENKKPKVEQQYVVAKQNAKKKNPRQSIYKLKFRKCSAEVGTYVIQEKRNKTLIQSQTDKTSKPQILRANLKAPSYDKINENSSILECENQSDNMISEINQRKAMQKTSSDIREIKSIQPEVYLNTQEELDMLKRLNDEQDLLADAEIESMIKRKNRTLINDFTQVKDPFRPNKQVKRSVTREEKLYDLQIENVVMSEEELSDLENNIEELKLEEIKKEGNGGLGGILDIDSKSAGKNNFQPIMKLLGIRQPKYLKNIKKQKNSQKYNKSRSVSNQKNKKNKINLKILAPNNNKSIDKISKKINNIEQRKFVENILIDHNKFHNLPDPEKIFNSEKKKNTKKRNTKKKNYLMKNKKNVAKSKKVSYKSFMNGKKSKTLFESDEPEYKINNVSIDKKNKKRKDRWSRERNKRKTKRVDSQKLFYEEIRKSLDKISIGMNSVEYKNSIDRNSFERIDSLEKRNLLSQNKSVHSKSPISNKKSSLYKKARNNDSINFQQIKNQRNLSHHKKKLPPKRIKQNNNFLFEEESYHDDILHRQKQFNKTHEIFLDQISPNKPSFNTGRLSNFLADFNIMNDNNFPKRKTYDEQYSKKKKSKLNKQSTQPIYKPSLNLKNLNYLTSNVKKPSKIEKVKTPKSKLLDEWLSNFNTKPKDDFSYSTNQGTNEEDCFLQSGIPLSVSQSIKEPSKPQISHKSEWCNIEEMQDNELKNLKNNFSSYSDRYSSNKSQNPWNPTIEVNMNSPRENNPNCPQANVKIKLLKNRKKKLIKRLSIKVDKNLINQFLEEIFEKFKKEECVEQNDIEKLNHKFFKHFDKNQKRLMPSIYQLIDVEIAIQSKELQYKI